MSVGGLSSISPEGLWIGLHHELSLSPVELPQNRWFYDQAPLQLDYSMAPALLCTVFFSVSFLMLLSADQKATSISTCWNVPCSSKPPGQETSLTWFCFPANLPRTLCPCAPSRVIVDDSPGYGRHPPTRPGTASLKDHVYFTSKSPWWSLIKASWRPISWTSPLPRINSFHITIQSLYINNPYLQKHFHFQNSLILST